MSRVIDISQFDTKFRENHRRFFSEHDALRFLAELFKAGESNRILIKFKHDKKPKKLTPQEQLAKDIDDTLR